MIRAFWVFVFVLLACVAALADQSRNPLVGHWRMTGFSNKPLDPDKFQIEWEFTSNMIIVRDHKYRQELSRNGYTIDLSKSPAWITIIVEGTAREIRPGIFRIRGSELHLKQEVSGGARPTDFSKSYSVLKRLKASAMQSAK